MFKCKECGAEYHIKPDYCDCGNDEFEGVNEGVAAESKDNVGQVLPDNNSLTSKNLNKENEKIKPQSASSANFNNQISQKIPKRTIFVDQLSLIIFITCIITSLYVIFFAWNGVNEDNVSITANQTEQVNIKNIPSIDKIWNNTPPTIVKQEPVKQEEVKQAETVSNVVKQMLPVNKSIEKKKTVVSSNKTASSSVKTTNPPVKKSSVQNNKTNADQNTQMKVQEQAKKAADDAAKKKAEQERKAAEEAQIKKLQSEQKAKQAVLDKQTLTNYKASLRNTIGRKIDFTRVIGDGDCIVSFQIDSNGKLINRSFSKQSKNNTLNDAVYAAVMATPSFNTPPSAYNNEILNLKIKFYNGNFEISLP